MGATHVILYQLSVSMPARIIQILFYSIISTEWQKICVTSVKQFLIPKNFWHILVVLAYGISKRLPWVAYNMKTLYLTTVALKN